MSSQKFRKLDIDLPSQTLVDQRPWLVAGLMIAFIVLLLSAYVYIKNVEKEPSPIQQKENFKRE
jgi:hypothetical protein